MNKRQAKKFEKMLLAEREHLVKEMRQIGQDTLESRLSEASSDLISFAEAGTDNNERETALRLASGESRMLREVDEALERVKDGTYGVCVDCEKPIPVKRLEAFPSAKRCVECKSRYEKESSEL